MFRKSILGTIVLVGVLALSGCNPPLPPEVRTAIMEQTVTCESGSVASAAPYLLSGIPTYLADTLPMDCPELSIEVLELDDSADLNFSYSTPSENPDLVVVPIALDAAVMVTNLFDLGSLAFSPETILGIFNGEITQWNDPAISKDNPFETMPEVPITLVTEAEPHVLIAFEAWMSNLTGTQFSTGFTPVIGFDYYQVVDAEEGALGLISFVDNFDAYMLQAGLRYGNEDDDVVIPDLQTLASAATQLDAVQTENGLTVEIDYGREPEAPAGSDEIVPPYQGIFPIFMSYAPDAPLAVRAAGFFALRQDSQGAFEQFSVAMLPESVRIASGSIVSVGLPQPEFTDEQLEQLGLD